MLTYCEVTMSKGICWLGGEILPLEKASISVLDHGLLYGDGVFEGVRFYNNQPFMLEPHLHRLFDSARAIALVCPWTLEELTGIVHEVIKAINSQDGYLRIVVTRGEGALGIDPSHCKNPRLIVIADALQMVDDVIREHGADLIIASTRRLPPDGLDSRIKSLNYLNHILARIEANNADADEAILLNDQGAVAEGSADNIFIIKQDILLTPPVTDGALAGITRQLVLELALKNGIDTREQRLTPYDLYTADECFLTGTGAELVPVKSIDKRLMNTCPGPYYQTLKKSFTAFIDDSCRMKRIN